MQELKPVAWRTMDCPPKEEDGTVLVWAENMPVSMGCCEDGYYVFTECEDLHNYFEGNEAWLREHWTLWMHLPNPCGKSLPDTHRIVSVKLLKTLVGVSYYKDAFMNACEEAQAIIDKEPTT
jgi:hypothetical protein